MKKIDLLRLVLIPVLMLGLEQTLIAQNFTQTIRGTVLDKTTQTPLPGASIRVLKTEPAIGTTTDADGRFEILNLQVGRIDLEITFLGYLPVYLRQLSLNTGKELVLNIELEEQAISTQEVVVTAEQRKDEVINKMASVSARSFSVEETERYAGSLGDPSRMASNFAGVSMVNDARNDIIIRGNSPAGLLWRVDGIEVPNPNHFGSAGTTGGPVSMLNNNLLTRSDFFTSAFPSEYGNAMSGVFDLKMRTGNAFKREYVAQVGFNGFELGAEGPFVKGKNATYLANYRYSTLGVMKALGINFGAGAAIPQYQDLTFKIDMPTKTMGRFSLFGMGGKSFIALHDSEKDPNDQDVNYNSSGVDLDYGSDMGALGLSHLYFFDENTRLNTYISVQASQATTQIDSLLYDSQELIIPNSNYRFYNSVAKEVKYAASTHLKKKINSRNNVGAGVYYELYQIDYKDSSKVANSSPVAFQKNVDVEGQLPVIRGYVQWQHKFNNLLTLNSGLYSQFVEQSDEITLEPRLGLRYQLGEKSSISAGYGLHSQMQGRIHYFFQARQADGSYIRTNEHLKLSKSHQAVLGYDHQLGQDFRFKSEVYYQYLFNIPVTHTEPEFSLINTGDDFGIWSPDSMVNTGTGENYGIEFTLEKFLSRNFYVLTTLSLYESMYKGYSGTLRHTAFDNNYILNVLGGYELNIGKKISLGIDLRAVYAGGKRYIPIDLEASKIEGKTVYNMDESYEKRRDNYFRTDLRLSVKYAGKKMSQEFAVDFQNLSNHQNIYSESYNIRTKTISKDYQTGFYPMFLYRVSF